MAVVEQTRYEYTGDGVTREFPVVFKYLRDSDVVVQVNGQNVAYTFSQGKSFVRLAAVPRAGATVVVQRSTGARNPLHEFQHGSPLVPGYLDENFKQALYVAQESVGEAGLATATSNLALSTAQSAVLTANGASAQAQAAEDKSDAAVQAANTAVSTSNAAVSTANSAVQTADSAVQTANAATATANSAVQTANAAVSTVNSAVQTAASAVQTANTAANDAAVALSITDGFESAIIAATDAANNAATATSEVVGLAQQAAVDAGTAASVAAAAERTANTAAAEAGQVFGLATAAQQDAASARSTALAAAATVADKMSGSNNLSELTNTAVARSNLGLGTAATRDVGTGSGNVMGVGAFGLGGVHGRRATYPVATTQTGFSSFDGFTDSTLPKYGMSVVFGSRATPNTAAQNNWLGQLYSDTGYPPALRFRHSINGLDWSQPVILHHTGNIQTTTGQSTQYPMTQKAVTDALNTKANTSTQVIAGTGLSGGGNLSANRTLSVDSTVVRTSGNQSIDGTKTFSTFPVTPSAAPTANYQVANKKYVDDNAIGVGQTWQNVTGSRVAGTTYTNSTGKPIQIQIAVDSKSGDYFAVGGIQTSLSDATNATIVINTVIPVGATYMLSGWATLKIWMELR